MKKLVLLFCMIILICLSASCGRVKEDMPIGNESKYETTDSGNGEENTEEGITEEATTEETTTEEETTGEEADSMLPEENGAFAIKSNEYEGKYVCEAPYLAFIDENRNVVVQVGDEKRQITDSGDIVKIAGGETDLILLKEDGTLAMCSAKSDYWISQKDLDRESPDGNMMENVWRLVLSASGVEDIAYNGYTYLAVKVNGEWIDGTGNRRCAPWNEEKLEKIVFDYSCNLEFGIRKDGTAWGAGETYDLANYGKKKRIVDIDCAFCPFLLYEDGSVRSAYGNSVYGGDVAEWENISQITVRPYLAAGLTEDGRVLVDIPVNEITQSITGVDEKLLEATEWENIKYIKAGYTYLLGVDADGNMKIAGKFAK